MTVFILNIFQMRLSIYVFEYKENYFLAVFSTHRYSHSIKIFHKYDEIIFG